MLITLMTILILGASSTGLLDYISDTQDQINGGFQVWNAVWAGIGCGVFVFFAGFELSLEISHIQP